MREVAHGQPVGTSLEITLVQALARNVLRDGKTKAAQDKNPLPGVEVAEERLSGSGDTRAKRSNAGRCISVIRAGYGA